MPFLKMKSKISKDSLREREKRVLGVSKKPSKSLCSETKVSDRMEQHLITATHNCHKNEQENKGLDSSTRDVETNEPKDLLLEDISQSHSQEIAMDTLFSPVLDDELYAEIDRVFVEGNSVHWEMPRWGGADESSSNNHSCNVSDFSLSDVLIASLPFYESGNVDVFTEISPLPHYIFPEPSVLLDVAEQYMLLPYLEDGSAISDDVKSDEEDKRNNVEKHDLFVAFNQSRSKKLEATEESEDFGPQLFIRNQPELYDVVSSYFPELMQPKKAVTLVLDLDETLVHSTVEAGRDTDFSFTVSLNKQENTVYVKRRPHLYRFLERVVELFHVVIFTASHSVYASQLLDVLDPDGKFVSQRFYRDSCVLSDGIYTKDLTVLGLDLAKVAIVDNCPQVYRLQVNNGIPIKSWYDDPTDDGLVSLLPFLETLADSNDVRPIIAKRFGNS
uniref:CTD small phosphatase-like protein 2 n=1 Tax=Noccaea caerulescens TaxID=107243 RepID=A0A1J3KAP1_NOCCA